MLRQKNWTWLPPNLAGVLFPIGRKNSLWPLMAGRKPEKTPQANLLLKPLAVCWWIQGDSIGHSPKRALMAG